MPFGRLEIGDYFYLGEDDYHHYKKISETNGQDLDGSRLEVEASTSITKVAVTLSTDLVQEIVSQQ